MKKLALMTLLTLVGALAFAADPKPYDSAAVKDIMRSNGSQMGAVTKAINAGDWAAVAAGFQVFAANAQKAAQYAPPKGDAKEWARIWEDFLYAAWRGIGAAGEKDAAKAKAALGALGQDQKAGHGQFL